MASQELTAWAVVVAAGAGKRLGGPVSKQFLEFRGEPLVARTLRALASWPGLKGLVVVSPSDQVEFMRELAQRLALPLSVRVVPGGAERRDSVRLGLEALADADPGDLVLIHDGVRPFPPVDRFDELCRAAGPDGALFAVALKDTVKRQEDGCAVETPPRDALRAAQTPQAFPLQRILSAHRRALELNLPVTDDASLIELLGGRPRLVEGDPRNIKITTPEDLLMAEAFCGVPNFPRVGHGYDVHRLVEGRPLILGGVEIPHEKGLLGHSDADVLAHAVTDACLGAAGLGDIGRHFPDTDPRWKGASSLHLLAIVREKMAAEGFTVANVDATVVAQRPKIAPHAQAMRQNLARVLGLPEDCVNIKGKTTEGLGPAGREEGIAAHAVATVLKG